MQRIILIKHKPHVLLLWASLISVLPSSFAIESEKLVDLHFHDTYLVVSQGYLFGLLAIFALLIWIIYLLTHKILYSKVFTWIYVIVTLLTILLLSLPLFLDAGLTNAPPRRYYARKTWMAADNYSRLLNLIIVCLITLLPGQFIYIGNLIAGLFMRLTRALFKKKSS